MQGCPPTRIFLERVRIVIQQQLDHRFVTAIASEVQRCPQQFVSGVNLCPLPKEVLAHLSVTLLCGNVEQAFLAVRFDCFYQIFRGVLLPEVVNYF